MVMSLVMLSACDTPNSAKTPMMPDETISKGTPTPEPVAPTSETEITQEPLTAPPSCPSPYLTFSASYGSFGETGGLYVACLETKYITLVVNRSVHAFNSFDPAPDGNSILFVVYAESKDYIATLDLTNLSITTLLDDQASGTIGNPQWSPDKRYI